MLHSKSIKSLAIGSLAAALCVAGQSALAHTSGKDPVTEGTSSFNALQIGHTCELENGKKIPIVAQSVVFPTVSPTVTQLVITDNKTNPVTTQETPTTLDAEITDALGIAGKADLIQNRDIFKRQNEIYDAKGNVIGFNGTHGRLDSNLRGLVPFRFTPVTFKATSCAKRMLVKIAVADICKKGVFPPKAGTANLWIPATTAKFTDSMIDGIGRPANLTINRDTKNNPLPETGCPTNADGSVGYDVVVVPSASDVDANLPIKGYWD